MVELICKYEPDINVKNDNYETPLQMFEREAVYSAEYKNIWIKFYRA